MPKSQQKESRSSLTLWVGVIVIAGGVVFGSIALQKSLWSAAGLPKLPIAGKVDPTGAVFPERLGQDVAWADLKGKVVVAAYAYSRCPHGCSGVAVHMLKLRDAFQSNPDLHLVSVAAYPELDTPASLKIFAAGLGVKDNDPWWWISGDRKKVWAFMTDQLKLLPSREVPEKDRLSPDDIVEHDLRAVLIDKKGQIRGLYPVMDPRIEIAEVALKRLIQDVDRLIQEP
ncbi:MAG: SCO family protein [Verrucomicrobiales bacterium]|nr:SCO family protein [Verrucomicrobiales bacterium]MCP5559123.1 SCO family protein [Verrucomicrobiaceae bacterium]